MRRIRSVCVLGGAGFVGRHLIQQLMDNDYQVRVLTRSRERHRDLWVLPKLSLVEADIHDPEALAQQFAGYDAVINFIGILNEKGKDGSGFRYAHVELPHKIVQACQISGIQRLLHMSALNADARNGSSHYLRSKGEGEDRVHGAGGVHVTSFRPSVIFGPDDSFFNRFATLLKISPVIFPIACPDARFAPVYVGDVVQAFRHALVEEDTFGQRYELCGPKQYTLKQLVEYTARVTGRRRYLVGLNDKLSRLQAKLLEFLPGKPFSLDNYQSLQTDSVCRGEFPPIFKTVPKSIESVVPTYLSPSASSRRYRTHRRNERPG